MPTPDLIYDYFDEFEIRKIVSEPYTQYKLYESEKSESGVEQLKIFEELETDCPLFEGVSFSNQVHFQNAYQIPVQRWFPYREGFSISLVQSFIRELEIKGNVFDPFVGSGTTLLEARLNNLNSFGTDVNPISALVAQVENEQYNISDIENFEYELNGINLLFKLDLKSHTLFELADKTFNDEILQAVLQFKQHIQHIKNSKIRNAFFVAWLAIIESVSNTKKEGNGIKYKNRKRTPNGYVNIAKEVWESSVFPKDKFNFVKTKLVEHLKMILGDIKTSYGRCEKKPSIFRGTCLEFDNFFVEEPEFTFFSPPYCNCFDYFEIHKVDLWLGEFIKDREEFRLLRNSGFRSNTNSLGHKAVVYKNPSLEKLIALFNSERLWSPKIPNVVRGYFDDTHTLLQKLYGRTVKGGYVGIVVGNSAYSGVIIPTDILIANIAQEIGFKVKRVFIVRHLTTSSQQKRELEFLKNYLRESIVLLKK